MNHKARAILIGLGAGALLGAAFAWVASDGDDKDGEQTFAISSLGPTDYIALGISILTLARQFGGMLRKA